MGLWNGISQMTAKKSEKTDLPEIMFPRIFFKVHFSVIILEQTSSWVS
jgi:hypothetical protein